MFVPSDGIYQAALAADPALIEYGVAQQVLMATPTTLIGLLRAVHYGWGQEQIAESAREIAGSARELHRRMGKFAEHLAKVGRQLGSAVNAYNDTVGSFDHRVIPQLRSIEAAGISSEREISSPAPIEPTARPVTARLEPGARRGRLPSRHCCPRGRRRSRSCASPRGSPPAREHEDDQRQGDRHGRRQLVDEEEQQVEDPREQRRERGAAQLPARPTATASSAPSSAATNRSP